MYGIPDDPIISCIERTGYPPWMQRRRILTPFGYAYTNDYDDDYPEYEDEEREEDDEC